MSEETKHPSLLAQEAKIRIDRIYAILNPEYTHFPSIVRINQGAVALIDIIEQRILAITLVMNHDTYGFESHLMVLQERYKSQLVRLRQISEIES